MTRPELFVFIALAVGWLAIAAWAFRISRKVARLDGAAPSGGQADR
jgi:hypothetical protein